MARTQRKTFLPATVRLRKYLYFVYFCAIFSRYNSEKIRKDVFYGLLSKLRCATVRLRQFLSELRRFRQRHRANNQHAGSRCRQGRRHGRRRSRRSLLAQSALPPQTALSPSPDGAVPRSERPARRLRRPRWPARWPTRWSARWPRRQTISKITPRPSDGALLRFIRISAGEQRSSRGAVRGSACARRRSSAVARRTY